VEAVPVPSHGHRAALDLTLPPLGVVFLRQPCQPESKEICE
jgi:hypothetical protein